MRIRTPGCTEGGDLNEAQDNIIASARAASLWRSWVPRVYNAGPAHWVSSPQKLAVHRRWRRRPPLKISCSLVSATISRRFFGS
jgi:hypothetical protein